MCNTQHFLRIVYFYLSQFAQNTLTKKQRGSLIADNRSLDIIQM